MDVSIRDYLRQGRDNSLIGTLAAHDRRFHPRGYQDGDNCKFREELKSVDDVDRVPGAKEAVDVIGGWTGGKVRVLDEDEASKAYAALGDDVRYFVTDAEQRFFEQLLDRYDKATPIFDDDGNVKAWKFGPRMINAFDELVAMPRVPEVIADAFKAAGFNPPPTQIRITPTTLEKIYGIDKMTNVNADRAKRQELYEKRHELVGDHPELNNIHGISKEDLRELLKALDNPVAIYRRVGKNGSGGDGTETLSVLTEIVDRASGKRSAVPLRYVLWSNGAQSFLNINTMFGRRGEDEIEQLNQAKDVYYVNREKVAEIMKNLPQKSGSTLRLGNSKDMPPGKIRTEADYSHSRLGEIISQDDIWCQSAKVRAFLGDNGQIAGWYNRKTGDTTLVKGRADAKTVAHEIGWHATFNWAEKNMPELHDKLVQYAKDAPQSVVDSVIARYGEKLSPEALLDEIGAERFTRENMGRIADEIERRRAEGWWDDVEDGQERARTAFVASEGKDVLSAQELRQIASLPPSEAVEKLLTAMLGGRSLETSRRAAPAMNRGDLKRFLGNGG